MKISRSRTHGDGHIFQLRYEYMDNLALLLQAALGDKGSSGTGDFVKTLPHVPLDDEIRLPGFVFERDERDAVGSAGALAQQHQSCNANKLAAFQHGKGCSWC